MFWTNDYMMSKFKSNEGMATFKLCIGEKVLFFTNYNERAGFNIIKLI